MNIGLSAYAVTPMELLTNQDERAPVATPPVSRPGRRRVAFVAAAAAICAGGAALALHWHATPSDRSSPPARVDVASEAEATEPLPPGALRDVRRPTRVFVLTATLSGDADQRVRHTPSIAEIAAQPGLLSNDAGSADNGSAFEPVRAMAPVPQLNGAPDKNAALPLANLAKHENAKPRRVGGPAGSQR